MGLSNRDRGTPQDHEVPLQVVVSAQRGCGTAEADPHTLTSPYLCDVVGRIWNAHPGCRGHTRERPANVPASVRPQPPILAGGSSRADGRGFAGPDATSDEAS